MSWTYTQNFDGLTTAALHGQDSWAEDTASSLYQVQTGTVIQGTKTVEIASATEKDIQRDITATTSGICSVKIRKASTSTNSFDLRLNNGATICCFVRFDTSGNIVRFFDATSDTIQAYSADTNYTVDIQYNKDGGSNAKYRVRVNGGSWSSFTNFYNTATPTQLDRIQFSKQNAGTAGCYFDDFLDVPATDSSAFLLFL